MLYWFNNMVFYGLVQSLYVLVRLSSILMLINKDVCINSNQLSRISLF